MVNKIHKTTLENLMPKSGDYPKILREAKSILVEEQPNLIPTYMSGMHVNFLEAKIKDKMQEGDEALTRIEQRSASAEINDFRGDIRNFVYGMKNYGLSGFPDLMVLTDDLNSSNPAISLPKNPEFSFEIKPKEFMLGLTGRLLEDEKKEIYNESLSVKLDIYDAFDLAIETHPNRVFAITQDGKQVLVYEQDIYVVGETEKIHVDKKHYAMSEEHKKDWLGESEVLPTNRLKIVSNEFYERIKKYKHGTMLFGHKYADIEEFLSLVTLTDDHLIWKICKRDVNDPNTPLIDAGPYYGTYEGKPMHHHTNRLHFMPDKASLWLDGTMISFDKPSAINALMSLGDVVRDLWIDPFKERREGWDIVFDRSRQIYPEKPVEIEKRSDYQKYQVLK